MVATNGFGVGFFPTTDTRMFSVHCRLHIVRCTGEPSELVAQLALRIDCLEQRVEKLQQDCTQRREQDSAVQVRCLPTHGLDSACKPQFPRLSSGSAAVQDTLRSQQQTMSHVCASLQQLSRIQGASPTALTDTSGSSVLTDLVSQHAGHGSVAMLHLFTRSLLEAEGTLTAMSFRLLLAESAMQRSQPAELRRMTRQCAPPPTCVLCCAHH